MFGLGSLIGGALKIGGSIFGGLKASQAMKQVENNLNNQMRDNQEWYDRRYNEDATQRADAQRMLAMTMDAIRDRSMDAKGSKAVMGGTEESMAATKAANANALADTAANIAVAGANRKDEIENSYRAKKDSINEKLNNLKASQAQNTMKRVTDIGNTAAKITGNSALNDYRVFGRNGDSNAGTTNAGALTSSTGAGQALKNISNVEGDLVLGEDGKYHLVR